MAELNPPPTGRLGEILSMLSEAERQSVLDHLFGGTSADWISQTLRTHGHEIGPTSIKVYRQKVRNAQGVKA